MQLLLKLSEYQGHKMIDCKKIITTVGPASFNERIIRKMEQAGVDVFRINLSHTPCEKIEENISLLTSWTDNSLVCLDTEGAQLRTGTISGGEILVEEGERIELLPKNMPVTSYEQIPLSIEQPKKLLRIGDILKIDFHSALLQVVDEIGDILICRILSNGKIGSNKGISVDREIHLPAFTEKDIYAFNLAKRMGINTIAFSFAAKGEDIEKLRQLFDYPVNIISKIESRLGLRNFEIICIKSNAVLIDRGDLSRDVPLEKIIFAQNYIIEHARQQNTPVYVATNLMENMIINSKPTRAEIHDIVATLNCGADGLVLAAETAIGKYPLECVRLMGRIIKESHAYRSGKFKTIDDFLPPPTGGIIEPHGGILVQQVIDNYDYDELESLPSLRVDYELLSDIEQIAEGSYSPLRGFMDIEELKSTLNECMLTNGTVWTLPILFQVKQEILINLPTRGPVTIRDTEGIIRGLIEVRSIQKLEDMTEIALKWFGTANNEHPGVFRFLTTGEYIIAGDVFMLNRKIDRHGPETHYILTPRQTRDIFNERNWHFIVGFHTRNVIHRGHEYIQKRALEQVGADALFISPVVGKKKKGDFSAQAIIACYDQLIRSGSYKPYGAILAAFNTYSRYSGPREAVFTAICRKNFGCSHFIIGRDHTGVGSFYHPNASQRLFDKLDVGIKILPFSTAYYCNKCKEVAVNCAHDNNAHAKLSGTHLRECLTNQKQIPDYLVDKVVETTLCSMYSQSPEIVFEV